MHLENANHQKGAIYSKCYWSAVVLTSVQ